ncbi:uncharacterized protein Dvar_85670 [Desulfosarcina variabilis str. Montpellier]
MRLDNFYPHDGLRILQKAGTVKIINIMPFIKLTYEWQPSVFKGFVKGPYIGFNQFRFHEMTSHRKRRDKPA